MLLSTKVRYSVRALVELALQYGRGPVKLKDIAHKEDLSLKYLEQVMSPLKTRDYVRTYKGSKGGYTLSRAPEHITVLEIVQSLEGSLAPVDCVDRPEVCSRVKICATREVWVKLKEANDDVLSRITLADLAKKKETITEAGQ